MSCTPFPFLHWTFLATVTDVNFLQNGAAEARRCFYVTREKNGELLGVVENVLRLVETVKTRWRKMRPKDAKAKSITAALLAVSQMRTRKCACDANVADALFTYSEITLHRLRHSRLSMTLCQKLRRAGHFHIISKVRAFLPGFGQTQTELPELRHWTHLLQVSPCFSSVTFCSLNKILAPIRDCSKNTELIDGMTSL